MAVRTPHAGRWTRRQFLEWSVGAALVGSLLEACGPAAPATPATAAPNAAAPTAAAAAATTAPSSAVASAPTTGAGAPGGQAIISFGEPDTLLMSESRALVGAYISS